MHVTSSVLQTCLDTARAKEGIYQASRDGKKAADTAQKSAKASAQNFALKARDTLRPFLGTKWSISWAQAGFKSQSLSVPAPVTELVELLGSLETYFTNHPTQQNATLAITAQSARQHFGNLQVAIETVSNCRKDQRSKRNAREEADAQLWEKMRSLRSELEAVVKSDDTRWLDFVEGIPADLQRPESVENLEVQGGSPGLLVAEWDASARAERYQVEVLVVGQDTEFRRVVTVREAKAEVAPLPSNAHVKVRVIAANGAGESAPSSVVEQQVPALAQAA